MASGGKFDWTGCGDSTPSSSTERNPNDQPDRDSKTPDWHGMEDSRPQSSSDRDQVKD